MSLYSTGLEFDAHLAAVFLDIVVVSPLQLV